MLFEIAKAYKKMKRVKFGLGIAAVIFAVAMVFAFTPSTHHSIAKAVDTQYHFTGSNIDQVNTPSWYELATGSETCSGSNLPCIISVPGTETLEQYLSSNSAQDILNNAVSTKN